MANRYILKMKMYELGRTGITITPVGLGCWQFAGGKGLGGSFWKGLPQEDVNGIVKNALDGGLNWFDTAEIYGNGLSERRLSAALQANGVEPGAVIIATKWFPIFRRAKSISETYHVREEALRPYPVDLHQVHNSAGFSSVESEMNRMADLVEEGRLRAVGVSNFGAGRMRAAHAALARRGIQLASNQVRYSLMDRKMETNGVLEAARELGITIIAYSPLSQGILTGKFHDSSGTAGKVHGPRKHMTRFKPKGLEQSRPLIESLKQIAADLESTPAQVALAWTIRRNGETVVAIPGASSESQIKSNIVAMNIELSEENIRNLDRFYAPKA
jgi:aryl-alcohol dehydrogenase-like predicted oxidoreductase